jgi:predicted nucleotidyltransferase
LLLPSPEGHHKTLQEARTSDNPPPATASEIITALRAHLRALMGTGVTHLSLFGSVACDEAGPDSDIDLAAEFGLAAKMDRIQLVCLARELGELLGRPVKILTELVMKPRLRSIVERDQIFASKLSRRRPRNPQSNGQSSPLSQPNQCIQTESIDPPAKQII